LQPTVAPLGKNQTFRFACTPQVTCFNACCRNLNQALTPYDVWCLKQFMNLSSGDFLDRYTEASTGPGSGLPVVSLRVSDADDLACPFVTDAGCRVYAARPASCRTYPLARGVSRDRNTGRLSEHWALIREPHCLGFNHGHRQTVDKWIDDQQISRHNHMNDRMLELISLKNRLRPGPLMPSEAKRIYTALYDLDAFGNDPFYQDSSMSPPADARPLDRSGTGDLDLLLVAMDWVRKYLITVPAEKA
jgi:Fe-S-cluster containining protein